MLSITTTAALESGKTYIDTGSTQTYTLPTPSAENEIVTIYSTGGFTLNSGNSTTSSIGANTKTLCFSTGNLAGNWTCMTFAGSAVTFA